jgi:uncharacterized protein (TIGR02246 family)
MMDRDDIGRGPRAASHPEGGAGGERAAHPPGRPSPDEQAIRDLVADWLRLTERGDVPRLLELMSEDVVFLTPGQPPLRGRAAFGALAEAMRDRARVQATARVQEVRVMGEWAYVWNELSVTVTMRPDGPAMHRSGPVLSILHRQPGGRWVIVRDANMLAADRPAPA